MRTTIAKGKLYFLKRNPNLIIMPYDKAPSDIYLDRQKWLCQLMCDGMVWESSQEESVLERDFKELPNGFADS